MTALPESLNPLTYTRLSHVDALRTMISLNGHTLLRVEGGEWQDLPKFRCTFASAKRKLWRSHAQPA